MCVSQEFNKQIKKRRKNFLFFLAVVFFFFFFFFWGGGGFISTLATISFLKNLVTKYSKQVNSTSCTLTVPLNDIFALKAEYIYIYTYIYIYIYIYI